MIATLTGSANSKIKSKWSLSQPYVSGYDIYCTDVYNVAYGKVVFVGHTQDNGYNVTVKCSNNEVVRYSHLDSVDVIPTQELKNDKIGTANKYVHFEYATSWRGNSVFPIRVGELRYYKQDPSDLLNGKYAITPTVELTQQEGPPISTVTYSEDQKSEFEGNGW